MRPAAACRLRQPLLLLLFLLLTVAQLAAADDESEEWRPRPCWRGSLAHLSNSELCACVRRFLAFANRRLLRLWHRSELVSFKFRTNVTEWNRKKMVHTDVKTAQKTQKLTIYAMKFKKLLKRLRGLSYSHRRMLQKLAAKLVYPSNRMLKLSESLQSRMSQAYSLAKGCFAPGRCLPVGENPVKEFFSDGRNYEQLRFLWQSWRNQTGRRLKKDFLNRNRLLNAAARNSGFADFGEFEFLPDFEDANFPRTVLALYSEILPLYRELHAYLRHRLRGVFPGKFGARDRIPGHLCNDPWTSMCHKWARQFAPYPNAKTVDLDAILKQRQRLGLLKVSQLPQVSESFYRSLGLPPMTPKFWKNSIFVKPNDRPFDCHGSAFDMFAPEDFRIKMCSRMDESSFATVHHEMGHIMYFMLYSGQPAVFRRGANSGFHEAVGDTITLSVKTVKHFRDIGFAPNATQSRESLLNTLLEEALENVFFLPYALVVDLWRWRVFSGEVPASRMNEDWWQLRSRYQGVGPSGNRTEQDADPLSKFHIANNIPYIRYFISFILKFDFYRAMCRAAGHEGELATCDFYKSVPAGDRLRRLLSLGSSVPWPQALRQLTGSARMSARPLLEYFAPLHRWLKDFNERHAVPVGWGRVRNPMMGVGF